MMSWTRKCISVILMIFATCQAHYIYKEIDQTPIELDELLHGTFAVNSWNGTWISDVAFIYKNVDGDVLKYDLEKNSIDVFLEAGVLEKYPGSSITISNDEAYVLIRYNASAVFRHSATALYTIYDIANKTYYDIANLKPVQLITFAPTNHGLAYVLENNIYYLDDFSVDVENPVRITTIGLEEVIYCGVPDWVYEEEVFGSGSALWFSPNSTYIAFAVFHDENVNESAYFLYENPGYIQNQYPRPVLIRYPKVGTANPIVTTYLYNINANTTIEFQLPEKIRNKEPNDYILYDLTWVSNEQVAMISTNRIQNESTIIRCSITGPCEEEEYYKEENGWLEPKIPTYSKDGKRKIEILPQPVGNDKYDHLVLTDLRNNVKTRLTDGRIWVLEIFGWDEDSDHIYYSATVEDAPSQQHIYSVNTQRDIYCYTCALVQDRQLCTYALASFSTGLSYYAATCAGPNPYYIVLQNSNNARNLTCGDAVLWEDNQELRNRLALKLRPVVRDYVVPINDDFFARVRLLLPPSLDETSSKKYPAIVNVYGGPNDNQIKDIFGIRFQDYIVTNREYVYIFIDGRGSGRDGWNKIFQMYKKFGTIEIEDQIAVTKYLQQNIPYIDSERTGIWGWSYGGFASSWALVKDRENVFNFALAVAPVTNFIYYDTIYTERYMGLPTPEDNKVGYLNNDLTSQVDAFRGRNYFIIHGTADDNVHYQNSMLLVRALQLADIDFRQQSYPDENHSLARVSPHLYHTIDHYWAKCFAIESPPEVSWNILESIKKTGLAIQALAY